MGILIQANEEFAKACAEVSSHHLEETEIQFGMVKLSEFSNEALEILRPFEDRYGERELLEACMHMDEQNKRQQAWLLTQIEDRAPHTLVVPQ